MLFSTFRVKEHVAARRPDVNELMPVASSTATVERDSSEHTHRSAWFYQLLPFRGLHASALAQRK